ncbi:MAG: hypothetical protein AB7S36_16480, partial [Planctomycetota bacterium]
MSPAASDAYATNATSNADARRPNSGLGINLMLFLLLLALLGLHEAIREKPDRSAQAEPEQFLLTPAQTDQLTRVTRINIIGPAGERGAPPTEKLELSRQATQGVVTVATKWVAASLNNHNVRERKVDDWINAFKGVRIGEVRVTVTGDNDATKQREFARYGLDTTSAFTVELRSAQRDEAGRFRETGLIALMIGDAPKGDEHSMDKPRFVRIGEWVPDANADAAKNGPDDHQAAGSFRYSDEVRLMPITPPELTDVDPVHWIDMSLTRLSGREIDTKQIFRLIVTGVAVGDGFSLQRLKTLAAGSLGDLPKLMAESKSWYLGPGSNDFAMDADEEADELKVRPLLSALRGLEARGYEKPALTGNVPVPEKPMLHIRAYLSGSFDQLDRFNKLQRDLDLWQHFDGMLEAIMQRFGKLVPITWTEFLNQTAASLGMSEEEAIDWIAQACNQDAMSPTLLPAEDGRPELPAIEITYKGKPMTANAFNFASASAPMIRAQQINMQLGQMAAANLNPLDMRKQQALIDENNDIVMRINGQRRQPTTQERKRLREINDALMNLQLIGISQSIEIYVWENLDANGNSRRPQTQPQTQAFESGREFFVIS